MTYDAVVVMGSGFKCQGSDAIDAFGEERIVRAIYAIRNAEAHKLFLTGSVRHGSSGILFVRRAGLMAHMELPEWRVFSPFYQDIDDASHYSSTTTGDVFLAIKYARKNGWRSLFVVTETPHWIFQVKPLFEKFAPDITVECSRLGAPDWYWAKEFLRWCALFMSRGKEGELLFRAARNIWKKHFAPRCGIYTCG